MQNPQDEIIELKKYLKRLHYIIDQDADFSLISVKIINKRKIDDIFCCIEAAFPACYKNFIKAKGPYKLSTSKAVLSLYEAVKNKFMFSTNVYSVRFKEALSAINEILINVEKDVNAIIEDETRNL